MTTTTKICPLRMSGVHAEIEPALYACVEGACAWWIPEYVAARPEGNITYPGRCAVRDLPGTIAEIEL